ncbi:hypothetical protein [Microbulbifer halophilus]
MALMEVTGHSRPDRSCGVPGPENPVCRGGRLIASRGFRYDSA